MPFPNNPFDAQPGAAAPPATPITVSQGQNVNPGGQEGTTPAPAPAIPSNPSAPYGAPGTSISAADLPAASPPSVPQTIPSLPTVPGQPGQAPALPNPPAAGLPGQTPPAVTPPATPAAQPWNNAREFAAAHGFHQASQFGTDAEFLQAVLQQVSAGGQAAQQLQALQAQIALQMRTAPAPAAAAPAVDPNAPKKYFGEAPEFNAAWAQWVERLPNGGYQLAAGCPDPTILPKYLAYQNHRQQMADKLLTDPAKALEPWAKDTIEQTVKPLLEQALAQQQDRQFADNFMRENQDWLYARDQQGQVLRDHSGRPMASPLAARFHHNAMVAERMGIKSVTDQVAFARQAVQNELYMARASQGATNQTIPAAAPTAAPTLNWHFGGPTQQPAPASFASPHVNTALRLPPNPTGSLMGVGAPGGMPQNANASLGEQLALALTQAGLLPRM